MSPRQYCSDNKEVYCRRAILSSARTTAVQKITKSSSASNVPFVCNLQARDQKTIYRSREM